MFLSSLFFFWAQIENSIARKDPKYNQPGQTSATRVEIKKHFITTMYNCSLGFCYRLIAINNPGY